MVGYRGVAVTCPAQRRCPPAPIRLQERCSAPSSSSNDSSSDSSSSSGQWRYRVTNVEYTEFERLGMADASIDEASTQSVFPANTNVLYVGLQVGPHVLRLPRRLALGC